MDTEMTLDEYRLLDKADDDFGKYGKTDIKCPRCGNDIIAIDVGTSHVIKCKTDDCIQSGYRGI